MTSCDLCPAEGDDVEVLGFDHRDQQAREDIWRIARVCPDCRKEHLMPALRTVFGGEGINLGSADGDDGWRTIKPAQYDASFFAFEGSQTWHAARTVKRAVLLPDEWRCVGHCGIEARVEPEPRQQSLSARREGITLCGRCARLAPPHKVGFQ
jgi:hypothetical protein